MCIVVLHLHGNSDLLPVKWSQHSTAQHSTSTAQHSTAQHSTAQHSTAQHSTAQHSTGTTGLLQHSSVTCAIAIAAVLSRAKHLSSHLCGMCMAGDKVFSQMKHRASEDKLTRAMTDHHAH